MADKMNRDNEYLFRFIAEGVLENQSDSIYFGAPTIVDAMNWVDENAGKEFLAAATAHGASNFLSGYIVVPKELEEKFNVGRYFGSGHSAYGTIALMVRNIEWQVACKTLRPHEVVMMAGVQGAVGDRHRNEYDGLDKDRIAIHVVMSLSQPAGKE